MKKPKITFTISTDCTKKNTTSIESDVYFANKVAIGITNTHVYTLSNRNVTIVLPPERSVK